MQRPPSPLSVWSSLLLTTLLTTAAAQGSTISNQAVTAAAQDPAISNQAPAAAEAPTVSNQALTDTARASAASSQAPTPAAEGPTGAATVHWRAALAPPTNNATALELTGDIEAGWHVYALTQPSGGPIALHITLDENAIAQAAGTPSGPAPHKHRDPSFGLETQFYTHSFTIHLPILLNQHQPPGPQLLPVSVRFQSCSDHECLPPTTAHLSVPVDVPPSGV